MQQDRYIAAVDLGSTKIAMTVAKVTGENVQIIYYKETPSDGVNDSNVFNPLRASKPVNAALREAENELGIKILQVVVGLPRYAVHQETASATLQRVDPNTCISQEEIDALKSIALETYPLDDASKEEIYGAVAQSFNADDLIQQPERDVVGSVADTLEGNFRIFVGSKKSVKNIEIVLNSLGVAPAKKIFMPHATASAVLTDEERDNGVALIEVGGGVTSLTIYQGRILRFYGAIPFGGESITTDIKYEGSFKRELAENIKLAFGACMPEKLLNMSEKILQINDEETGAYEHLPVKYLSEIITARAKEIIDAVLFQIQESGYADRLRSGVVVTGGCANLANFANLVKEMSGYKVRIGYPRSHMFSAEGCPDICDPSAAASIGLILTAKQDQLLNCTTEPVAVEEEENRLIEEEPVKEVESYEGTIFDETANKEVPQKPKKEPKPKKEHKSLNIQWGKKISSSIGSKLGKVFDDTIGGLYDGLN